MSPDTSRDPLPPLAGGVLALLVGVKLVLHLALAGRYGYFRDELYFLDCGRHLDWGYVDHAPLIGLLAKFALVLGGSLPVLRGIAALFGAAAVAVTILLARELGGGRVAQGLAGLAVLVAPIVLGISSLFTMNVVELVLWPAAAWVLVRRLGTGDPRWWLAFGAIAGVGLLTKHSMVFFGAAVVSGLLLTRHRRDLATPWPWLGGALALLLFAPNLAWQAANGFPTLEGLQNVRATGKNVILAPPAFLAEQVMMVHPVLAPVWLAGLVSLLVGSLRRYRVLGLAWLVLLALMMALHAKSYYLAPSYPILLAAGGVAVERALASRRLAWGRRWLTAAAFTGVVVAGAVTAPLMLPLLTPEGYLAYQERLGLAPRRTEVGHVGALPQIFGDQFGWPELVADVARIYHALPPAERAVATIFASNYGEAGAVNLFGPALGLPRAISGHQTHFFWGPGDARGDVVIVLQGDRAELEQVFASVEEAGRHHHPWGMVEENRPIHLCRGLKVPLADLWPEVKHWN